MTQAASAHPKPSELTAHAAGRLAKPEAQRVARHLDECSACRDAVARLGRNPAAEAADDEPTRADRPRRVAPMSVAASQTDATIAFHSTVDKAGDALPEGLDQHPKFRVLRKIGEGGMGEVYLAEHRVMERQVALKVIRPALLNDAATVQRFRAEVKAAARLSHPNIVTAYDAEQSGDLHLLVLEYVEGISLIDYLKQKGPLPIEEACHFIRQAALGLQHAHEMGMVHRDIKPQNLMLTPKGQVKILDFGLARLTTTQPAATPLTVVGTFMGTPDYISPEQVLDCSKADIRSDIYSLGCTFYNLLTGQPPFVESTTMLLVQAHIGQQPEPVTQFRPQAPAALADILAKMLAKQPGERYQTPMEVARALAPFCKKVPIDNVHSMTAGTPDAPARQQPVSRNGASAAESNPTVVGAGELEDLITESRVGHVDQSPDRERHDTTMGPRQPRAVGGRLWRWLGAAAAGLTLVAVALVGIFLVARLYPGTAAHQQGSSNSGSGGGEAVETLDNDTLTVDLGTGSKMLLRRIPAKGKTFWMSENEHNSMKQVALKDDYFLGIYTVTQGQWKALMGNDPSYFGRSGKGSDRIKSIADADLGDFPVENVSWDDAQEFLAKLNTRSAASGWTYCLPTEAEWEFACRAGAVSREECAFDFYFKQPTNDLSWDDANFNGGLPMGSGSKGASLLRTTKVGSYTPNALGLYDMHGNVWQWCSDTLKDGSGKRALRGGCWAARGLFCRTRHQGSQTQDYRGSDVGFRVVRVPVD